LQKIEYCNLIDSYNDGLKIQMSDENNNKKYDEINKISFVERK